MRVDFCADGGASPEASAPCSTVPPSMGPNPSDFTPDAALPWTGTAWFYLLLGVAIGALIVGGLLLYYSRRKRAEVD